MLAEPDDMKKIKINNKNKQMSVYTDIAKKKEKNLWGEMKKKVKEKKWLRIYKKKCINCMQRGWDPLI